MHFANLCNNRRNIAIHISLLKSRTCITNFGAHLVSPIGGHLFVVNLETLEQRIIQAPGLSLDSDWAMPSWRR